MGDGGGLETRVPVVRLSATASVRAECRLTGLPACMGTRVHGRGGCWRRCWRAPMAEATGRAPSTDPVADVVSQGSFDDTGTVSVAVDVAAGAACAGAGAAWWAAISATRTLKRARSARPWCQSALVLSSRCCIRTRG